LKDGKLDRQTASIMGQLGTYLLRAIEGNNLERRIETLEKVTRAADLGARRRRSGSALQLAGYTNGGKYEPGSED
jgi:hypothetical protein